MSYCLGAIIIYFYSLELFLEVVDPEAELFVLCSDLI